MEVVTIKKNIGLVKMDSRGYDFEKIDTAEQIMIWADCGYIEIGKNQEKLWVAQYSIRTDIDDYAVYIYYFNKKPNKQDIITARLIRDIEDYFNNNWKDVIFKCWECRHQSHWLDIPGNLQNKWESFQERYCGC